MRNSVRVLIIEDNEDDTILEIDELISGGYNIIFERIETRHAMREALRNKQWDCIISDYSMPQFSGLDALAELKEANLDIPFILVSGAVGEETAVAAMKAGAHDYIMKNNLKRLVPAFERELREAEIRNQKRKVEETIRYERILLRTLIDNLPDTIYVKDTDRRKIVANTAYVKLTGYSSEADVIGKNDIEIFKDEAGRKGYDDDLGVLQTGQPILNREEDIIDAQGKHRWLLVSKIPMMNEQGQISGLVGLGYDITDRKLAELALIESEQNLKVQNEEYFELNQEYLALNEELVESLDQIQKMNAELIVAKDKAEESDKLKSAFLANVSHEIRTPLNAIMGFSGFLKDPQITKEKTEKFVDIIESSGQQLLSIISDILDISKIEAGQITISIDNVKINKVLKEMHQLFKIQADSKNIGLAFNNENDEENLLIETDENRLRQIISNLLNNAVKFTSEGKVEFGYKLQNDFISIYIKDTGIGIAPEDQDLIFKPFRQVETSSTRNYGGNGLGLSISKALVEKLGGTLKLESELQKGSTFIFSLPHIKKNNIRLVSDKRPDLLSFHNWNKFIILIAEDEVNNYCYIEEILSSTKVKTLHAWDGKEAVKLVKERPDISLVLMDIKMPEMDGYAATRIIKELRPQLPVIAQTAYALSEDREKSLKSGFDNYIAKPVTQDFFMEVIGSYLG